MNRAKIEIFVSVQQLYKEFDKITTFAQLRKQYCDKKFEIELLLCIEKMAKI